MYIVGFRLNTNQLLVGAEFVNYQFLGFFNGFEILPILIFELVHVLKCSNHFLKLFRASVCSVQIFVKAGFYIAQNDERNH